MQEQKLQQLRSATIKNNIRVLEPLDKYKPLDECTADDLKQYIEEYIKEFEAEHKKKPETSNLNFIYGGIKKYYIWAGKHEIISWIKMKNSLKKINPNKLLTPAEVQTMLRICDKDRDKCMIAMAYESGMRIGELLSLRVEDIKIKDGEYQVRIPDNYEGDDVDAKTGSRLMTMIESLPYVEKHLKTHDGGALLFDIKRVRSGKILRDLAKKAGIKKRVYWHLLRHTRATEMAKMGMQETAMKKRFGWTPDSKMIDRYISITDTDADDSYREALGLGIKKKNITINPIATRCAKCGKLIETGEFCEQCAEIQRLVKLNEKMQIEKEELKEQIENQEADFFIQNHSLAKLREAVDEIQKKMTVQEEKYGFQTGLNASAWEEGTGRVIEWKNGVKTVREPTVEDYIPNNPLDHSAPSAITEEQKERARVFDETQKKVREEAKAKGVITAAERAKMLLGSSPQVRAEAENRGAPGAKERTRKRAEKLIAERKKADKEQL